MSELHRPSGTVGAGPEENRDRGLGILFIAERFFQYSHDRGVVHYEVPEVLDSLGHGQDFPVEAVAVLQEGNFIEERAEGFSTAGGREIVHLLKDAAEQIFGCVPDSPRRGVAHLLFLEHGVFIGPAFGFGAYGI